MNISLIIDAMRVRCASFGGRVAGAAEYTNLPKNAALITPCAFVLPLDDAPEAQRSENAYRQLVRESFAVVVALDNTADPRGQAAATSLHALRAELWRGLLGWKPEPDYNGIEYEGGQLLDMDRAQMWFQYEFAAEFEIGEGDVGSPETWQQAALEALPAFDHVRFTLDTIDPHDPNLAAAGPDGRAEAEAGVDVPTS